MLIQRDVAQEHVKFMGMLAPQPLFTGTGSETMTCERYNRKTSYILVFFGC